MWYLVARNDKKLPGYHWVDMDEGYILNSTTFEQRWTTWRWNCAAAVHGIWQMQLFEVWDPSSWKKLAASFPVTYDVHWCASFIEPQRQSAKLNPFFIPFNSVPILEFHPAPFLLPTLLLMDSFGNFILHWILQAFKYTKEGSVEAGQGNEACSDMADTYLSSIM